eukprot:TRINITY_DN13126_c0_g1_i2.p1 TRINITY_DN13126_c0_g1~~TRINITY_DN13126_c0_g1_i2.p1  ORF type:complete len:353 (-),score=19.07 TRINITY_DN13126_c0_g1_i2:629-1687(-)
MVASFRCFCCLPLQRFASIAALLGFTLSGVVTAGRPQHRHINRSHGPLGRVALLVRGILRQQDYLPESSAKKLYEPYDHDFLLEAWPSMERHIVAAAWRRCSLRVDVYLASYFGLSSAYAARARNTTKALKFWLFPKAQQFELAAQFLQAFRRHMTRFHYNYKLIIMTRNDFVFSEFFWPVMSAQYNRSSLNLVMIDCIGKAWDGLHVLRQHHLNLFIRGFQGRKIGAHYLRQQIPLLTEHTWVEGLFDQPDRCTHPLGTISRRQARPPSMKTRCCSYGDNPLPGIQRAIKKGSPERSSLCQVRQRFCTTLPIGMNWHSPVTTRGTHIECRRCRGFFALIISQRSVNGTSFE